MNTLNPERALANHTWHEVAALAKDQGLVVLPIGAIEQHGLHLPLCTDATLADQICKHAFGLLKPEVAAWFLPTLPYGKSNEHLGFAGTITLSANTLGAVIADIARSLHTSGFRRLLLFNGHGGNNPVLQMAARDLRAELGIQIFIAMPEMAKANSELPEAERRFGIHAGRLETAWMLQLTPNLVHLERSRPHFPKLDSSRVHLNALPQVAWLTRDWSSDGHFGDPTKANKEEGQRWLDYASTDLAELITELSSFEVSA